MHEFSTREVSYILSLVFTIIALAGCGLFEEEEDCGDSSYKVFLSWSPDGEKIAFRSDGQLHVINADGTGRVDLTADWGLNWWSSFASHSWSPDGTKIAFDYPPRDHAGARADIHITNVDGTSQFNLTNNNVNRDVSPSWSPDGTKIAFESSHYGASSGPYDRPIGIDICVMNADGTSSADQLSHGNSPSWSPDGTKIAYSAHDGSLWVMNADGTDKRNLTESLDALQCSHRAVSWSPDGTKIVFEALNLNGWQICVINTDGTSSADHLSYGCYPYWSPDGEKIVYSTHGLEIYVMNADGAGKRKLTKGYCPSWSPDGTKIAFLRCCGLQTSQQRPLWVMNADGTNERRLAD